MARVKYLFLCLIPFTFLYHSVFELLGWCVFGEGCRKAEPDHSLCPLVGTRKKVDLRNKGEM